MKVAILAPGSLSDIQGMIQDGKMHSVPERGNALATMIHSARQMKVSSRILAEHAPRAARGTRLVIGGITGAFIGLLEPHEGLAASIHEGLSARKMNARAAALGARIRKEDGVAKAVDFIEGLAQPPCRMQNGGMNHSLESLPAQEDHLLVSVVLSALGKST